MALKRLRSRSRRLIFQGHKTRSQQKEFFIQVPEGTSNIKINVPIAILAEEDEDITEAAKMAVQTRTHHRQESVPATASTPSTQLPAANTSSQLKTRSVA